MTGAGPGVTVSLLRGQRHFTCKTGSAIPASGVDVRIKGRVNGKALELQLARRSPASDCSVVIHTQAGPVEASGLLSSGNGTVCPRRPAQAPGSLMHLFAAGLLHCSSWWAQEKKRTQETCFVGIEVLLQMCVSTSEATSASRSSSPAPVSAQTHLLSKSVLSSPQGLLPAAASAPSTSCLYQPPPHLYPPTPQIKNK